MATFDQVTSSHPSEAWDRTPNGGGWDGSAVAEVDPGTLVGAETWPIDDTYDPANWEFNTPATPEGWSAESSGAVLRDRGVLGEASDEYGDLEYRAPMMPSKGHGACCGSCADGGACGSSNGGESHAEQEEEEDLPIPSYGLICCNGLSVSILGLPGSARYEDVCLCEDGTPQAWEPPCCPSEDEEKVCGPDVTDWLVEEIRRRLWLIRNPPKGPIGEPGEQAARAGYTLTRMADSLYALKPGGALDLTVPGRAVLPGKCPIHIDCKDTVTLCGVCTLFDAPGNIAFGALGGYHLGHQGMRDYSNDAAVRSGQPGDPPHDVASLEAGYALLSVRGKDTKEHRDNMKKKLCELITKAIKGGKMISKNCPPCTEK